MPIKKYATGEGELEVLRGEEAVVVQSHLSKTGKAVSDFSDEERKALHKDLDKVRPKEDPKSDSK